MKSLLVLCHYDGTLRREEKDLVFVEGDRRVVLIDKDVMSDEFECQIRRVSGCKTAPVKII